MTAYWGLNNMEDIPQTTIWNVVLKKIPVIQLKYPGSFNDPKWQLFNNIWDHV